VEPLRRDDVTRGGAGGLSRETRASRRARGRRRLGLRRTADRAEGVQVVANPPDAFVSWMRTDVERTVKLIKTMGIREEK
jgi:hypothetical protein